MFSFLAMLAANFGYLKISSGILILKYSLNFEWRAYFSLKFPAEIFK